jgi:hypothetical protein
LELLLPTALSRFLLLLHAVLVYLASQSSLLPLSLSDYQTEMHTITLQDDISLDQWDEEEQEGLKLQGEQQQQQQQQMPWLSPHAISPKSVDEDMDKAYSRGRGGRKGG